MQKIILKHSKLVLLLVAFIVIIIGSNSLKMQIDASADTLLLEDDKDLLFANEVSKRYMTDSFLVVTFRSKDPLLSDKSLKTIQNLSDELSALPLVKKVTSILNVPLLQSPPLPLSELLKEIPTLNSPNTNKTLAKQEFLNSPLYKQNLVSDDFKTTALLVNLKSIDTKEQNHQNIQNIRKIVDKYRQNATINLGGISMIADDLITFVKNDLEIFSLVVFGLLIIILFVLFGEIRWVVMPISICTVAILTTTGILGYFDWKVTVISSNFISLQLIMTISLVIHLTIRYKELLHDDVELSQYDLILQTVTSMLKPSFFVVLTTIAGFSSLVYSGILPVITFGYMMSVGLIVSFVLTFILFPTILLQLKKSVIKKQVSQENPFTLNVAKLAYKNQKIIIIGAIFIAIFSITGANKLYVENSFIDYFKKDTDIYKGMKDIDENLGGTTPLDVIITFKDDKVAKPNVNNADDVDEE